jgi:hypothetical protein
MPRNDNGRQALRAAGRYKDLMQTVLALAEQAFEE